MNKPENQLTLRLFGEQLAQLRFHGDWLNAAIKPKVLRQPDGAFAFGLSGDNFIAINSLSLVVRRCLGQNERANTSRVASLLYQCASERDAESHIAYLRGRHKAALDEWPVPQSVLYEGVPLTPKRVIDVWFNGHLFHSDPQKRPTLEEFQQVPLYRRAFIVALQQVSRVALEFSEMVDCLVRDFPNPATRSSREIVFGVPPYDPTADPDWMRPVDLGVILPWDNAYSLLEPRPMRISPVRTSMRKEYTRGQPCDLEAGLSGRKVGQPQARVAFQAVDVPPPTFLCAGALVSCLEGAGGSLKPVCNSSAPQDVVKTMSPSNLHAALVNWGIAHLIQQGATVTAAEGVPEYDHPSNIHGFRPDIVASLKGSRVFGEAKATADDLGDLHTLEQLQVYLDDSDGQVFLFIPSSLQSLAVQILEPLAHKTGMISVVTFDISPMT